MALSLVDRILIQRTQEAMEAFDRREFQEGTTRRAWLRCPAPGCTVSTNGGPCKKHWRMRQAMSEGPGKVRR